jgi:hypothetical protein
MPSTARDGLRVGSRGGEVGGGTAADPRPGEEAEAEEVEEEEE